MPEKAEGRRGHNEGWLQSTEGIKVAFEGADHWAEQLFQGHIEEKQLLVYLIVESGETWGRAGTTQRGHRVEHHAESVAAV